MTVRRVLVANRGEIALRVIRACHEEGLEAVAVHSDIDHASPHVRAADVAVELGGPDASESYLNVERLLAAARQTGADAIHPGYGFLAERADFADAVADAGLVFVGPPPAAIRAMGEKTAARRAMAAAGVPIVPGTDRPAAGPDEAAAQAQDVGLPVLLKAAAGGGGKGMRVARTLEEVRRGFEQARSEAAKAFGDGAVYLERFIERPRHVEIQILADAARTIHLGERECSVQRRHQKLIEETPSPAVDRELRRRMGATAVRAAESVGYLSAGTVEFLLAPSGEFYFLEMNTRLQVEHPITELVYGVDLVREQLRIAAGQRMTCPDRPLTPRGHAIECRITAEDPFGGFLPVTGHISYLQAPTGPGVRWDAGVESGSEVSRFYDSLLGKLIVWGEHRERAIRRMGRALDELMVVGMPTSQAFHRRVMNDPSFASGRYDIEFVERIGQQVLRAPPDERLLEAAVIAAVLAEDERRGGVVPLVERSDGPGDGPWLLAGRRESLR